MIKKSIWRRVLAVVLSVSPATRAFAQNYSAFRASGTAKSAPPAVLGKIQLAPAALTFDIGSLPAARLAAPVKGCASAPFAASAYTGLISSG